MPGPSVICALFLTALLLPTGSDCQDCRIPGWFGKNCELKCQCDRYPNCNSSTGDCEQGDTCKVGYFGPGCQYVDMGFRYAMAEGSTPYVHDGSDETCNRNPNDTVAHLYLTAWVWTDWLRVVFNYPVSESVLQFYLVRFSLCLGQRRYLVNNLTVDVTCNPPIRVREVIILGPMVAYLCTIYISGGRNIALKRDALRAYVPRNNVKTSIVVDGITNYRKGDNSCSTFKITPDRITKLLWTIYFKQPQKVYKIVIYNSDPPTLKYFDVSLVDVYGQQYGSGLPTECHTSPLDEIVFDFPNNLPTLVVRLQIAGIFDTSMCPQNAAPIDLCEIEVYGDADCPQDRFGRECEQNCNCKVNHKCHPVTGNCSTRCPIPRYGAGCMLRCRDYCFKEMCRDDTGACFQCHTGYHGDDCNIYCNPGTYGIGCVNNCSTNCVGTCSIYTGKCSECVSGFYGQLCTNPCPEGCQQGGTCHKDTGKCVACLPGLVGDYCSECSPGTYGNWCDYNCSAKCESKCYRETGRCLECVGGFYGKNCTNRCSEKCQNQICDRDTGQCYACISDHIGQYCTEQVLATNMEAFVTWLFAAVLAVLLFLPLTLILCIRRDQAKQSVKDEGQSCPQLPVRTKSHHSTTV